VIVCFVDIGGIVDHHCLNILPTNINTTNHRISPKEYLNSEDQQFHPYQQNKQSHFT
jgi:thermostable 8-oxoguanine DNA glycosylase